MLIQDAAKAVHKTALSKGWYATDRQLPELLMLIVSEAAEALEAYREYRDAEIGEELADIVIRVFDAAEYLSIDIQSEILSKMARNEARPYRHGFKRC